MSSLKNITSVYKKYSKYPSLNSAKFISNNDPIQISSLWIINDLVTAKAKNININFQINKNNETLFKSPPIIQDEDILMDIFSPSFKYRAICMEKKNSGDSQEKELKTNLIYFWSGECLLKSISLADLDVHGPIYKNDFNFGNFQWLEDGKKLMYIAEGKKSKKLSYFQNAPTESSASKSIQIGNQFKSKKDFGELLGFVENPVICILDLEEDKVEVLDSNLLCPGATLSTFCVHPKGLGFVFSSYKKMPFDLGIIYCTQRCLDLFYYDLDSKTVCSIGDEGKCKMSPKFSPDGNCAIWIENDANGPHMQCQRLMKYDFANKVTKTIVDIVRDSFKGFPGIYNLGLTDNCWTNDGRYVFLTSQIRFQHKIILIEIETGIVDILNSLETIGSETLLDVNDRFLLVKVSSPTTVPYLAITDVQSALSKKTLSLIPVSSVYKFEDMFECQLLEHEPIFAHPVYGKRNYQSIFIKSKVKGQCPLILMLHGGPHSAFNTDFFLFVASVAELGYHALMVNYRGSWGYDQNFIESLLGHIGEMDVSDCINACEDVISRFPSDINGENIFLYGGSHGGFLAAHLSAKYSKRVKAAACRNPVINVASMLCATDIPDWNFTEIGLIWNYKYTLDKENILAMWEKSPLKYVNDIKCPVLIMIGQEDKRVPPSQGMELHKALLARSIPTELYIYPKDSHPLASVEANSDCFVNVLLWFQSSTK